jgi:hypothetical protein
MRESSFRTHMARRERRRQWGRRRADAASSAAHIVGWAARGARFLVLGSAQAGKTNVERERAPLLPFMSTRNLRRRRRLSAHLDALVPMTWTAGCRLRR